MRLLGLQSFIALTLYSNTALAACECGYSVNSTTDESFAVFTDLIETDFLHLSNLAKPFGWRRQDYAVSAEAARGPYGKRFSVDNVVANPLKKREDWAGHTVHGGDAGLQFWVRSKPKNGNLGAAELGGDRQDLQLGSFRVAMKLSPYSGTCGAFFWYSTDTQEIDVEFLSKEFSDNSSIVNYVLQTPQSMAASFDASRTPSFKRFPIEFRPDGAFHEYRFDWLKDRVSFYTDGQWQYDMTKGVPTSPGHLVLNHWSNGDGNWSAGPPESDAAMTVSYIKAYFNSSNTGRQDVFADNCPQADPRKVCQIPDQKDAPDQAGPNGNQTSHTYFFSLDNSNDETHTPGQIVYESFAATSRSSYGTALLFIMAGFSAWSFALFVLV